MKRLNDEISRFAKSAVHHRYLWTEPLIKPGLAIGISLLFFAIVGWVSADSGSPKEPANNLITAIFGGAGTALITSLLAIWASRRQDQAKIKQDMQSVVIANMDWLKTELSQANKEKQQYFIECGQLREKLIAKDKIMAERLSGKDEIIQQLTMALSKCQGG